jgi:ribonuclease-3
MKQVNSTAKKNNIEDRLDSAERLLGYRFTRRELLQQALSHPSAVETQEEGASYERLEFLGDSILGAIVAHELFDRYQDVDEGGLTRMKVSLVSGATLAQVAADLGLGDLIIFGSSERGTGGRGLQSALENVYEALVAALALDGGMEVARDWVIGTLGELINEDLALEPENPKSALQEILQVKHITPTYELVSTDGPPHARLFTCNVLSGDKVIGTGSGHSKKDAEVQAAIRALRRVRWENERKKK